MFYVERWRRSNKKELAIIHIGPSLIVLIAFVGITIWAWAEAKNTIADNRRMVLESYVQESNQAIQNRMNTYEDMLRAGVGLFANKDQVARSEWKSFVDILSIADRYPGILGLGYAEVIPKSQLAEHEQIHTDADYPNYSVNPKRNTNTYTSIVFLEPNTDTNKRAIGYDMTSEPARKAAMERARDTGQTSLSDIVTLIQDQDSSDQPGFLMYLPHYKNNTSNTTLADRQKNIAGYVYAPFRSSDLFGEIGATFQENGFAFELFDAEETSDNLLYRSQNYDAVAASNIKNELSKIIIVDNQTWVIHGVLDGNIATADENGRPTTILWIGILLSAFIAIFIYMLLLNRTRALASRESSQIQDAKDELLALASHQLRTPATGVKQYLGLLLEGYAGKLTKNQKEYIQKAYDSNERQLNTINQMLFVARADAGNIKITLRKMDIAALLREILEELQAEFAEKNHNVTTKISQKPVYIEGDEQYLRMAIENIISNAIKYTNEGGRIQIRTQKRKDSVVITCKDNGVGVDQTDADLLFKKFSRIPNDLTSKVSGSGIGLYLTKSIIRAHQGTVLFESSPNIGSTVTITLKYHPAVEE